MSFVQFGQFSPNDLARIQKRRQQITAHPEQVDLAKLSLKPRKKIRRFQDEAACDKMVGELKKGYERFETQKEKLFRELNQSPGQQVAKTQEIRSNYETMTSLILQAIEQAGKQTNVHQLRHTWSRILLCVSKDMPNYSAPESVVKAFLHNRGGLACATKAFLLPYKGISKYKYLFKRYFH